MDGSNDDFSDYDVVSDLGSSVADLIPPPNEPPPAQEALDKFATVKLSPDDIQLNARLSLGLSAPALGTKRVYVDGFFDLFNAGHALQLRQAKLSFPSVHLICGVFSDSSSSPTFIPHLERCELLRHCRWVDQVFTDAPWQITEDFIREQRIDYVVVDEGTTVDPKCDKVRLAGYDIMKRIGKAISTKRTKGLTLPPPLQPPILATPKSPPLLALASGSESEEVPEPLVEF